jgi:hypothetical protein
MGFLLHSMKYAGSRQVLLRSEVCGDQVGLNEQTDSVLDPPWTHLRQPSAANECRGFGRRIQNPNLRSGVNFGDVGFAFASATTDLMASPTWRSPRTGWLFLSMAISGMGTNGGSAGLLPLMTSSPGRQTVTIGERRFGETLNAIFGLRPIILSPVGQSCDSGKVTLFDN